jgi:hypothetical protein
MNKNLLRSLRRKAKSMFDEYCAELKLSAQICKANFLELLRNFGAHLLMTHRFKNDIISNIDEDEFIMYLGLFINFCSMKKHLKGDEGIQKLHATNDLLYKYSQHKFYEYITKPEVHFIIKIICVTAGVENLVQSDSCLEPYSKDSKVNFNIVQLFKWNK